MLALGGAHECDQWRTWRGACALCGQADGPPAAAGTPFVAGDRVRVPRGGGELAGVVVRVIGRSFVVECPGPLFLLFNATTAAAVTRDDAADQDAAR